MKYPILPPTITKLSIASLLVFIVLSPGLQGNWGRDDFVQLALVRFIESPALFFLHDHFPDPHALFRPLGFTLMWIEQRIFGHAFAAHTVVGISLHVLVAGLLFRLLRACAINQNIAIFTSIGFALHPTMASTALWWSARFDLLSTAFVLIALERLITWRQLYFHRLIIIGIIILAAMLSKELGLIAAPLAILTCACCHTQTNNIRTLLSSIFFLLTLVFGYFIWRYAVLGTIGSSIAGKTPLMHMLFHGFWIGLYNSPSYWFRLPYLGASHLCSTLTIGFTLIICMVMLWYTRKMFMHQRKLAVLALGTCLLPFVVQAPVAVLNAAPLSPDMAVIDTIMQSRLYYLSGAGLFWLLAFVISTTLNASKNQKQASRKMSILSVLLLGVFAITSYRLAHSFATTTRHDARFSTAALESIKPIQLPKQDCELYFLGIELPTAWSIYVSMDAVVKVIYPNLSSIGHCLIHTDYPTFFYFRWANAPESTGHYESAMRSRHIGNLRIEYLDPKPQWQPSTSAQFFMWKNDHFENISAIVLDGSYSALPQ